MNFLQREIGYFFVGIMFLTRLPVPANLGQGEGRLARSARYFPLIGVLIGLLVGLVYVVASELTPPGIAAGLALVASMIATGALHEDGLADCCDGLGGGGTREEVLEIMRDSRVGAYGVVGLVLSLGLRWIAIAGLTAAEGMVAIIVAHAVSRAMIPPVLVSGAYARTRGLASSIAEGVSGPEAAFAMIFAFAVAMIAGPVAGLAAMAAAIIAGGLMLSLLIRRIGGYTGDGLGAIQQVSEVAILCVLAGLWA